MIHTNKKYFHIEKLREVVSMLIPEKEVKSIERVDKGISSNIFKLEGDERLFLRITSSLEESYTPEYLIHQNLREIAVKVPKIICHKDFYEPLGGHSLLITSEIEGSTISETSGEEVLYEAGVDLAKIHSLSFDSFGYIKRYSKEINKIQGTFHSYREFLFNKYYVHLDKIYQEGIINRERYMFLNKLPDRVTLEIKYGSLLHGDLSSEHIFENKGTYAGIIDFSDSKIGSRYLDLGYFKINNRNLFKNLLRGYVSDSKVNTVDFRLLSITTVILGVRMLSYAVDDSLYIDKDIFKRRRDSFDAELDALLRSNYF